MKTNKLLAAVVLVVAIGAPIAAYVQGLNAPQSTTSPGVLFIHGFPNEQRLHQPIRQAKPIADRQFEIELLDSGAEAFSFTFG